MAYQFEPREASGEALKRIAGEEIDRALETLASSADSVDHRIHEARKHLKKLRAVFALARGSLGDRKVQKSARSVRRAAHALAPLRGEAALVECFESLEKAFPGRLSADVVRRVRALLDRRTASDGGERDGISIAREQLLALRDRLSAARFEGEGWSVLEPGFRQTYARARKAYVRALDQPASEVLHTFRTPTKRHFYQVQMLEPIWPELLRAYRKELSRIGDLLGDHHDLSLLGPELEKRGLDRESLRAVGELVDGRSRELEKEVLALGGLLFAERPADVTRRFAAYFDREWPTGEEG